MNSDTTQTLRLFYALWPDDATRAALARLQTTVSGRKVAYENLHMTLAFLGEQAVGTLPALREILAALPVVEMPLILDRIGYFTKSRIAWAGTHAAPAELIALQRDLMNELSRRNILADTRSSLKPHITLARDAAAPDDPPFDPIHWHAGHVCLVASSAGPKGVCYRLLASNRINPPT